MKDIREDVIIEKDAAAVSKRKPSPALRVAFLRAAFWTQAPSGQSIGCPIAAAKAA